eukprot:scaffold43063_cov64-Attheya_sp.AAC.2
MIPGEHRRRCKQCHCFAPMLRPASRVGPPPGHIYSLATVHISDSRFTVAVRTKKICACIVTTARHGRHTADRR